MLGGVGGGSWLLCACDVDSVLVWGWEWGLTSPGVGGAGAALGGSPIPGGPPCAGVRGCTAPFLLRWLSWGVGFVLGGMGDPLLPHHGGSVSYLSDGM